MEEMNLFGEPIEITPLKNAASANARKVVTDLRELGIESVVGKLFRQSGGLAPDTINVLIPVYCGYKRRPEDTREYAIVAIAKFDKSSTNANKRFLGFTFTGSSALFNRTYYYEDKVNKEKPVEYATTRFGTPKIGTFNDTQGDMLIKLCNAFTTFSPLDKRPEIVTDFDDTKNVVLFVRRDNGEKCQEIERQTYEIYNDFTFTDAEKAQLIEAAKVYFGLDKADGAQQGGKVNRKPRQAQA